MAESEYRTLGDLIVEARRKLNQRLWDSLSGGSETETTIKRNRLALDRIAVNPKVLRDVRKLDLGATLIGHKLRIPVFTAPVGSLRNYYPGGAIEAAQAVGEFGCMHFLSSAAARETKLEDVRAATKGALVFQLYVDGDDDWVLDYAKRVIDAGYASLCLNVDTPVDGRRERDYLNGHVRNPKDGPWRKGITWDLIKKLRGAMKAPLMIKGIACGEDAKLAVDHGVDVIYVSNHGGRNLDNMRGSVDMLREIVDAVGRKTPVIVDGGFVRGADVVKALALGATAVGIGKLQAWAVAAEGKVGLLRCLELLELEMQINMTLMGAASIAQLDRSFLTAGEPVTPPHVLSSFPHLELPKPWY